jgi:hypothetical protein
MSLSPLRGSCSSKYGITKACLTQYTQLVLRQACGWWNHLQPKQTPQCLIIATFAMTYSCDLLPSTFVNEREPFGKVPEVCAQLICLRSILIFIQPPTSSYFLVVSLGFPTNIHSCYNGPAHHPSSLIIFLQFPIYYVSKTGIIVNELATDSKTTKIRDLPV